MKPIFVGQIIRKPVNYSRFLSDGSAINFILLKVSRAKIKVYNHQLSFSIINSVFHLRLPRDVSFRLKLANFWLFFAMKYRLLDIKTTLSVYRLVHFTHKKKKDTFC